MLRFFNFVLLPVLLTSFGELLLKGTLNVQVAELSLGQTFMNPFVILSYVMILTGGILWLVAMSKYELSFLYPFLSLNFLIILVGAQYILNEQPDISRYVAAVLIVIGLIFISKSKYSAEPTEKGV